jgi:hypothetical protein
MAGIVKSMEKSMQTMDLEKVRFLSFVCWLKIFD